MQNASAPPAGRTSGAGRHAGRARWRSILAGTIGNAIEYYDWYVYSAFGIYFARAFFPAESRTAELLNTAAVFAVGFVMRPIGGWILGAYADRHGRRAALVASIMAMGGGSLLIGLTPGYATIGIAAPALLVLGRVIQGFSLGGEYASSATYLSEVATPGRRGLYSSLLFATLSLGQLTALLVLVLLQRVILTEDQLAAWGWRIPFLIGAALAGSSLWLRSGMAETLEDRAGKAARTAAQLAGELLTHWRSCLTVVGLTLGGSVAFYTYTTYMQKFLVNTSGFDARTAGLIASGALVCFIFLQPVMGGLSDRIGRRPLLLSFGALGTVCTVPLFTAIAATSRPWHAFWLVLAASAIVSLYSSVSAVAKAEIFPAHIRSLGVGVPYSVTVSLLGGTAEFVALWLKKHGHEAWFYWYVAACIGVSFVTYLVVAEPLRASHIEAEARSGTDARSVDEGGDGARDASAGLSV